MNRKLILNLLQNNRVCSRIRLAEQSGLKQATITNIVNDFMSWGLVEETGLIEGRKGRRVVGIQIKEESFYVIGIRLSRKHFEIGMFTLLGNLAGDKYKKNIENIPASEAMDQIQTIAEQIIAEHKEKKIVAIGAAIPGPYYYEEGIFEVISNFPGWKKVPIKKELQNRFGIPVVIDHDANAGVLAECSVNPYGENNRTVAYIAVGQGIGAGVCYRGEIFRGAAGIAGEIGHASINFDGPLCECGNRGCLTVYASTLALLRNVNHALQEAGRPAADSLDEVIRLIREKDKIAYYEFKKVMNYLSTGILNLIYNYNPDLIIIGDEMSRIGTPILEEIQENFSSLVERRVVDQAEICLTNMKYDSAFIGAAELAINYAFAHTELFHE